MPRRRIAWPPAALRLMWHPGPARHGWQSRQRACKPPPLAAQTGRVQALHTGLPRTAAMPQAKAARPGAWRQQPMPRACGPKKQRPARTRHTACLTQIFIAKFETGCAKSRFFASHSGAAAQGGWGLGQPHGGVNGQGWPLDGGQTSCLQGPARWQPRWRAMPGVHFAPCLPSGGKAGRAQHAGSLPARRAHKGWRRHGQASASLPAWR